MADSDREAIDRAVQSVRRISRYFSIEIDRALMADDEEAVVKFRALWNDTRRARRVLQSLQGSTPGDLPPIEKD